MNPRVSALLLFLATSLVFGADWPHWRGPGYDGAVNGTTLDRTGGFGLQVEWRRELGSGYSAVVVAGDTAVTMFSDHRDDFVVALEASSGRERWRYRLGPTYRGHDGSEDGPAGTPTLHRGRVFALGPKGLVVALDLDTGRLEWSVDVAERFGPREPRFGFTAAPLALDDIVMISVGAEDGHSFVAFDAASGEMCWATGEDTVSYETSIPVTLGDRSQILAMSNHSLAGLDPAQGEVLWEFDYHTGQAFGTAQVVPLGDGRLVVQNARTTTLYRYAGADADPPLEEIWSRRVLGSALSTPVVFGDHLYGFAGNFLTAVSLADGEKVWKSRPPGGTGLLLADGKLIALGNGGALVAVRATPEGYRELARVDVFDQPGVTYPAFAGGRVFVRNTREIAAVRVVDAAARSAAPLPPPADEFEAFTRRAALAPDPRAAVRDFMRHRTRFPLVVGERVHLVHWGSAEDVAVAGSMTEDGNEEQLARIPDTDFFHRSYTLAADTRAEYWFVVDFDKRQPDALNPRRRAFPRRWYDFEVSELVMPGYEFPTWSVGEPPPRRGTVAVSSWTGGDAASPRNLAVYLPPAYDDGETRYPLAIFVEGDLWRSRGELPQLLDRAIAAGVLPPLVAALVGRPDGGPAFDRSIANDVVPTLQRRYRIDRSPGRHAIVARLGGTLPAIESALGSGGLFGHAVLLDPEWLPGVDRHVLEQAASLDPERRATLSVRWSRALSASTGTGQTDDDRRFLEALEALGYGVSSVQPRDAPGWWSWGVRALEALAVAFEGPE